jgi:hypothetical protein
MRLQGCFQPPAICFMEMLAKRIEYSRERVARLIAEQLTKGRRVVHLASAQIPVPDAVARALDGELEPLFALSDSPVAPL